MKKVISISNQKEINSINHIIQFHIKRINFDRNSDDRSKFILNHSAAFDNFHAKNPKSGETISTFIKEINYPHFL